MNRRSPTRTADDRFRLRLTPGTTITCLADVTCARAPTGDASAANDATIVETTRTRRPDEIIVTSSGRRLFGLRYRAFTKTRARLQRGSSFLPALRLSQFSSVL